MDIKTHDLLRIKDFSQLFSINPIPVWVKESLDLAPFVVVRRASTVDGKIPVGIRGKSRSERFGCFLQTDSILEQITPEQLVHENLWLVSCSSRQMKAIDNLGIISNTFKSFHLDWGPTGSVGFELASRVPTVTEKSDVDLIVRTPTTIRLAHARELLKKLNEISVRVDVQLETPFGAISLAEYCRGGKSILLRSKYGPVLVKDPWNVEELILI